MAISLLTYDVKELAKDVHVAFNDSASSIAIGPFDCTMKGNTLTMIPTTAMSTVDEARAVIEPLLRDLEAEWDLRGIPIAFRFSSAQESPDDSDPKTHKVLLTTGVGVSVSMSVKIQSEFKGPSGEYRSNAIVDYLRYRWLSRTRPYEELPTSAAYALATYLESLHGSLKRAAKHLNVSAAVLKKARALSSVSDPRVGRKFGATARALSPEELGWLGAFIQLVGKRAAAVASGNPAGPDITLAHPELPRLLDASGTA